MKPNTTTAQHAKDDAQPRLKAFARWADVRLAQPATTGALQEQRHVLNEAAHPEQVAAFIRLGLTSDRGPALAPETSSDGTQSSQCGNAA